MQRRKALGSAALTAGALLWIGLVLWLGFLWRFQHTYQKTYFAWLRSHLALPMYSPPTPVGYRDQKGLLWFNFWEPEGAFRWSIGRHSAVLFRLTPEAARTAATLKFTVAATLGPQKIDVIVNDKPIGSVTVEGATTLKAPIPPGVLVAGANSIELLFPQARTPLDNLNDIRILAIGVTEFALEPGTQNAGARGAMEKNGRAGG